MFGSSKLFLSIAVAISVCVVGTPAHANVGLPMIIVVWPAMWLLLVPIILLEAMVAVHVLHLELAQAFRMVGIANLFSTLVGIPITWFILLAIQMRVGKGGGEYGLNTLRGRILSVTLQSPWMLPYSEIQQRWMMPAAELCLCVPCFLMSVWTEFLAADWSVKNQIPTQELLIWSWIANGISYGLISTVLLLMFIKGALNQKESNQNTEENWLQKVVSNMQEKILYPMVLKLVDIAEMKVFEPVVFLLISLLGMEYKDSRYDLKKDEPCSLCRDKPAPTGGPALCTACAARKKSKSSNF